MRGDLRGHEALAHVGGVGQAQMLGRRDVAEEVGARSRGNRAPDGGRDVVVARRDVGAPRPMRAS